MRRVRVGYLLALMIFACSSAAASETALVLKPYYAGNCAMLQGTWQGFAVDPEDLFAGGPWSVQLTLVADHGNLTGHMISPLKAMSGIIHGVCRGAVITKWFTGKASHCGGIGDGALLAKDALLLKPRFQNAMTGTQFIVFLQRGKVSLAQHPVRGEFDWSAIKTCH